jgi:ATP-dependent Clp protease ATP-binding subunit ClpA
VESDIRRDVERRFSPEFLNRIDEVVLFSPLTPAETRDIAAHYVETIRVALAKANKTLDVDDEALTVIAARGHSPAHGARFLKRVIDERIKLPISARWHASAHFRVTVAGDDVAVEPRQISMVGRESIRRAGIPA